MRRRAFLVGAGIAAAAVAGAGLLIPPLVLAPARAGILADLGEACGTTIKAEAAAVSIGLPPAVVLDEVSLGNPASFGEGSLIRAKRISVRVSILSMMAGRTRAVGLQVTDPVLLVETNESGRTNFEAFLDKLMGEGPGGRARDGVSTVRPAGISMLDITGGRIEVKGAGPAAWRDISIRLARSDGGAPWQVSAGARLLGSRENALTFEGTAGPFTQAAAPVDGRVTIAFQPRSLAETFLRKEFGVLAAQGEAAQALAEAGLKGDLRSTGGGKARLRLTEFTVGRNVKQALRLQGELAGEWRIERALIAPEVRVDVVASQLSLDGGKLTLKAGVSGSGGNVHGTVSGVLSGLKAEQVLGAFFEAEPPIHGELPALKFEFSFAGRDAQERRSSLSGAGSVEVRYGQIDRMDLAGCITAALKQGGTGEGPTEFTSMSADFSVGNSTTVISKANVDGISVAAAGGGKISFDGQVDLRLNTRITGRIAELAGAQAREGQPAEARVPIEVTGTVDKFLLRPTLRGGANRTGTGNPSD